MPHSHRKMDSRCNPLLRLVRRKWSDHKGSTLSQRKDALASQAVNYDNYGALVRHVYVCMPEVTYIGNEVTTERNEFITVRVDDFCCELLCVASGTDVWPWVPDGTEEVVRLNKNSQLGQGSA